MGDQGEVGENNLTDIQKQAKELIGRCLAKVKEIPPAVGLEEYEPRPDDIVVTTFPKSGTTLTQQLTYQTVIATGGAPEFDPDGMNFNDICEVCPFVDFGTAHGFPASVESNPRVYKSHSVPKMFKSTIQKHLVVIRDPCAYPASFLDFVFEGWTGEDVATMDPKVLEEVLHEMVRIRLLGITHDPGTYFASTSDITAKKKDENEKLPIGAWFLHAKGWFNAMRPNILVMFYEDIVKDMGSAAKRVARFMGRELDEDGVKHVITRCNREYMSQDIKFACNLESKALGFGEKMHKCKPKHYKGFKQFKVNDVEREELNKRFQQEFGVPNYEGLKDYIDKKQKEIHDY